MTCEWCNADNPEVTDRGACMVAHYWACLARCLPCQSEMADEWDGENR